MSHPHLALCHLRPCQIDICLSCMHTYNSMFPCCLSGQACKSMRLRTCSARQLLGQISPTRCPEIPFPDKARRSLTADQAQGA